MFVQMTKMIKDALDNIFKNILWGFRKGGSKVPLVAWQCITQPKDQDGLGFKDLTDHANMLLNRWTMKLLDNPNSEWAWLYLINLDLVKWTGIRISRHFQYSFQDKLLFGEVESIGCFKYTNMLWVAWVLVCRSVLLVVARPSLLGRWRTTNVLPFLLAFEELTVGQSVWLIDTLARIGIVQLKHLLDDRRLVVERWGEPLTKKGIFQIG